MIGECTPTAQPGATVQSMVTRMASWNLGPTGLAPEWETTQWCSVGAARPTVERPGVLCCTTSATVTSTPAPQSLPGTRPASGGGSSTRVYTLLMYSHHSLVRVKLYEIKVGENRF